MPHVFYSLFFRFGITLTMPAAASGIRAADTPSAVCLFLNDIADCKKQQHRYYRNYHSIYHEAFPSNAYSDFKFLFARTQRYRMIPAMASTAIIPPVNPAPTAPVVTSVPI